MTADDDTRPADLDAADLDARFREFARSPLAPELLALDPPDPEPRRWGETSLQLLVVGVVFGALALVLFGFCAPLGILPLALMGWAITAILKRPEPTRRDGPVERLPAFVRGVATSLTSDAGPEATEARIVTLDLEEGASRQVRARATDLVTSGDFGVAYLVNDVLVHFERVTRG
ncbi:MAG: hypothetical protein WD226_06225 [Planctomycetota bacterium]